MVINFGHMVDSETCHFIDRQCLNGYTTPQSFLAFVVPVATTLPICKYVPETDSHPASCPGLVAACA